MDILDTQIKGITGRIILWLVGAVGAAIVTVMGTYFATTDQIKATEVRIMSEIKDMKADQKLIDTIQDRDILELRNKITIAGK